MSTLCLTEQSSFFGHQLQEKTDQENLTDFCKMVETGLDPRLMSEIQAKTILMICPTEIWVVPLILVVILINQ